MQVTLVSTERSDCPVLQITFIPYIGETRRRLETRLREHQEACQKGTLEKSAVAVCTHIDASFTGGTLQLCRARWPASTP